MNALMTWLREVARTRPVRLARIVGAYMIYALRRFYRDGGLQASGALTFTTLLALVPLMTIAFSIFSAFPAFQAIQDRIEILLFENLVPEVGSVVRSHMTEFMRNATNLTTVGVVALGVSAVLLLSTVEAVFNTIWRVERERPIMTRLLIFWTLLTLGPVLLGASFSLTTGVFDRIGEFAGESAAYVTIPLEVQGWGFGGRVVAAALQTLAFTVMFALVPARPVLLRDAAMGGLVAGVALEVLKWAFRLYIISFPSYQTIYGALAVFPIFLIWMYLSWTVVIIGAVFAASFPEWRNARAHGIDVRLDPARRLEAAVVLLAALAARPRDGVSTDDLVRALPMDERDRLIEALRQKAYLVLTDDGGFALIRDLHTTTLADLARDLDLTLGLDIRTDADPALRRAARKLDAGTGRLADRLGQLFEAEQRILGLPIADLLSQDMPADGSAVIKLPQGSPTPGSPRNSRS